VSPYLLDVNVLVAMAWPRHAAHSTVQKWLARYAQEIWATCPFTQAGFVRIISNPAFSRDALSPKQALSLLRVNLDHPNHRFWPDTLEVNDAMTKVRQVTGHNQITDAYLLALAISRRGTLVTLDKSVANLMLPSAGASGRRAVIVL
jgi:toxin-antitoxin system PIN domain toxin